MIKKTIMNVPPPLPLRRSKHLCIENHDSHKNVLFQDQSFMNPAYDMSINPEKVETYRRRSIGYVDIDHPRNINIPLKLNRQVTV